MLAPPDDEWVAATAVSNRLNDAGLLDWLNLYGEANGYTRDEPSLMDTFNSTKGAEFERAAVEWISAQTGSMVVEVGASVRRDYPAAVAVTVEQMKAGVGLIWQPVFMDSVLRLYGKGDLLIRSDLLHGLYPEALTSDEAGEPAPEIGMPETHYRVIDMKFARLEFLSGGDFSDSPTSKWRGYKMQLWVYNKTLGDMQGYTPPVSYLLGRGWEQEAGHAQGKSNSSAERLGIVPFKQADGNAVTAAADWLRDLRNNGASWQPGVHSDLLVNPSVDNRRWSTTVGRLTEQLDDPTRVYMVRAKHRANARKRGVTTCADPRMTAETLGVTGEKTAPRVDAILDANREPVARLLPSTIQAGRNDWYEEPPLEFYVDFETVTDLYDNFTKFPLRGGQEMIYMIGCGHIENGEWKFAHFTALGLFAGYEERIVEGWLTYMQDVVKRFGEEGNPAPQVLHWSHAESTAYNAAVERAAPSSDSWQTPNWYDLFKNVIQAEPVTIKGCYKFGLKEFAKAMHTAGLIQTEWPDEGPEGGADALAEAFFAQAEIDDRSCMGFGEFLLARPNIQNVVRYNEIDCKAMMEILRYLRQHH